MLRLRDINRRFHLAGSVWLLSIFAVALGTISCGPSRPPTGSGIVQQTLRLESSDYSYYFFSPSSQTKQTLPLLFLVHGGGGNGLSFLRLWQDFARQTDVALLAPTLSFGDDLEKRVPEIFPALVEDAKRKCGNIDPKRIYLFGYAEGGYLTFDAATLDSTYFAAAAVLAGIITPDYDWIAARARRKTPIAIYIGDRDRSFSLAQAQRTRDMLLRSSFPIHYVAIKEKHSNYGADFAWVQQDSWNFMREYTLP